MSTQQRPQSEARGLGGPVTASAARRVLVVEDAPSSAQLLVHVLSRRGHQVVVAQDGREAIALWSSESFDVILMDIEMPILDGMEATTVIRAREARQSRPRSFIVALTAHAREVDRQRFLAAGLDACLVKPINLDLLVEVVESSAGSVAGGGGVMAGSVWNAPAFAVFDGVAALARLKGDLGLLREMVRFFHEDAPGIIEVLRSSLERDEVATLQRAAHTLSGMAAVFEGSPTVAAASRVEALTRSGARDALPAAVARLVQEVERLDQALVAEYLGGGPSLPVPASLREPRDAAAAALPDGAG
jgi:CheY-like chemotaxis protein